MQAECRTSNLLVRYVEVPAILCKVTEKNHPVANFRKKILGIFLVMAALQKTEDIHPAQNYHGGDACASWDHRSAHSVFFRHQNLIELIVSVGNGDERDGRVALRLVARQDVVALSSLLCNRAALSLADVYLCDFAAGALHAYVSSLGACKGSGGFFGIVLNCFVSNGNSQGCPLIADTLILLYKIIKGEWCFCAKANLSGYFGAKEPNILWR